MIIDDNGYVDPHHFTAQVHILEAHGIWSSLSARPTFSSASCIPRVPTRPPAAGLLKISTLRWLNFWAFFFVFFLRFGAVVETNLFFFAAKLFKIIGKIHFRASTLQQFSLTDLYARIPAQEPAAHRLSS